MKMMRLFAVIIGLFLTAVAAHAQSRISTAPFNGGTVPNPITAPYFTAGANVTFAAGSSYGGVKAIGGAVETVAVVCYSKFTACPSSQPVNVLTLVPAYNYTTSVAVTVNQGANQISLGASDCYNIMSGSQISIPTLGTNGSTYTGHIIACQGSAPSATLSVDTPVPTAAVAQTLSVTFGSSFPSNIAYIMVQGWNGGRGLNGAALTVSAYNSASSLTLSSNTQGDFRNGAALTLIMAQADDSVAMGNACAQAMGTPSKTLYVQGNFYVPSLPDTCYAPILRALDNTSAIYTGAGWVSNVAGQPGSHKEFLIPPDATSPPSPQGSVIGWRDLPATRAAQPNVNPIDFGDSLETPQPNGVNGTGTYSSALDKAFLRDNPGINIPPPNLRYCGYGGTTMANLDGNPASATLGLPCWNSTATSFVTQLAALNPTLVKLGVGTNDGIGFDTLAFTDVFARIRLNMASQFTTTPDLILSSHHGSDRTSTAGNTSPESQQYGAGVMRSFADVMSSYTRYVDGLNEGAKHVWGYDIRKPKLVSNPTMPFGSNSTTLPLEPTNTTHGGVSWALTYSDYTSTFWGRMTGNGGVTDSRGAMMAFEFAPTPTTNFDNVFWVFYNTSTHVFSYECDLDMWHVGLGCTNPATGVPPVTPSLTANIAVANSGAGGNAVVTASTPAFYAPYCYDGATVAIPQAGTSHTVPGFGNNYAYKEPLIAHIATGGCVSSTVINLDAPAVTTYTATRGAISWGNPVITTTTTDVGYGNAYAGGTSTELIQVELAGDFIRVWSQQAYNIIYSGYFMHWDGAEFAPLVFSGGNTPAITIASSGGLSMYQTGDYELFQPDFIERGVLGPSIASPMLNPGYIGSAGGDGYAHNVMAYGTAVIDPLYGANNFAVGPGGGVQTVSSGASGTVSGCSVSTVNVNDTTAPTITIPAYCAHQITIQDTGGHGLLDNITVAAPSGLTLIGVTSITANYGKLTVTWTSPTTATVQ